MDRSDSFQIQCPRCGMRERLTISGMETREVFQCFVCGTTRSLQKEDILQTCRDAASKTRQAL